MKKITLFLLAMSVAVTLSGCKKSQPETEVPTEAPTEIMTESETETETEPPTEPVREDSLDRTKSLKGLVTASATDSLTIQTERGKELEFSITGADIQLSGGIQVGGNVVIRYKGTINGTDTSNARVQMIVDLAEGETPVTEGEPMTEAEMSDPDAGSGSIGGTIEDLNTDRIVIIADDGESYYFSTYGAQINLVNGLQQGNYVTVEYTGDLYGPDLVQADAIADNDPSRGEATVRPGASNGDYSYVSGTIVDCSTDTTTIETDDGEELTFNTGTATQYYSYGIVAGNYVTIEYSGTISDSDTSEVQVHAVYDTVADDDDVPEGDDEVVIGEDTGSNDAGIDDEADAA